MRQILRGHKENVTRVNQTSTVNGGHILHHSRVSTQLKSASQQNEHSTWRHIDGRGFQTTVRRRKKLKI